MSFDSKNLPLRLDLEDERLWNGRQAMSLSPKPFSMLRFLVNHPNRLLTKEEILEAVWPSTFVTEGLVKENIQEIRKALGDDPKKPRFIETVRGRGYRYLGGIEIVGEAEKPMPSDAIQMSSAVFTEAPLTVEPKTEDSPGRPELRNPPFNPQPSEERRLAAIFVADVVGYTSLMGADESGTLRRLTHLREKVLDPLISEHHGRIVKLMGDGLLVEFASAVDSVACAMAWQDNVAQHEANGGARVALQFRIGINLGDVIVENGDIHGDGVNVAARLEGLADPGGVCISRNVFNQVKNKVEVSFEDLGEQEIKNIPEPIRVFRVLMEPKSMSQAIGKTRKAKSSWRRPAIAVVAIAIAVVAAVGVVAWLSPWHATVETASVARMAHPLPDKPSIAVLPFTNMSDDPAQEYFADGMTEDLITDLSKVSGLFVIARNSVFTYKGKNVKVHRVAEDLGVRYVLEGSVRRAGDQVRISAQLIDAATGGHLWSERYDGRLDDVFGLQDQVTRKIVAVLAVQLTTGEEKQFALRETENTVAYDVFLKGWDQYLRQTPESLRKAITHFERAVELDSKYSRAYAALSTTYWQIHKRYWHRKFGLSPVYDPRLMAEEFLEKAKRQPTALSHQVATAMLSQQGLHTEAMAEGGKAIGFDPNDADSYVALAGALSLAGDPDKAQQLMQKAMRLNPHFPPHYLYELGLAQFGIGDFRKAAESLEKATVLNSEDGWSYRLLLATYGHLGQGKKAEGVLQIVANNWRGFDPLTVESVASWYPFKEPADAERLAEGLRQAGVPD